MLSNVVYSLFFRVRFSGRYRLRGGCDLDAVWGDKSIPGLWKIRGAGADAVLYAPFVAAPGPRTFYGEADARERVLLSDGGGREKADLMVVLAAASRVLRFRVLVGHMLDGSRRQTPVKTHLITGHRRNLTTITTEMQTLRPSLRLRVSVAVRVPTSDS